MIFLEVSVKREIEKNSKAIHDNMNIVLSEDLKEENIKEVFKSIRILVDYTESLILNGSSAIEKI